MIDSNEWFQFMKGYRRLRPQFAFSFHGELSHDSINLVGAADDDISKWLRELHWGGLLNRTILIVMADHGNRFADVRKTLQGKQEERLPFFSFTFPEAFRRAFPAAYQQFKSNVDRLTTPFDVHATLVDILSRLSHCLPKSLYKNALLLLQTSRTASWSAIP